MLCISTQYNKACCTLLRSQEVPMVLALPGGHAALQWALAAACKHGGLHMHMANMVLGKCQFDIKAAYFTLCYSV